MDGKVHTTADGGDFIGLNGVERKKISTLLSQEVVVADLLVVNSCLLQFFRCYCP